MSETDHTTTDAPQGLAATIAAGLRSCRVDDDAPVRLIREGDIYHVTHMVTEQVRAYLSERFASPEVVEAVAMAAYEPDPGDREDCWLGLSAGSQQARMIEASAALAAAVEAL